MFLGQHVSKLTQKNRLVIPSIFRKLLGTKVIITRWYEGCLVIIQNDKFGALLHRLTGDVEKITQNVRDTERFVMGSAFDLILDDQGRFVVPKILREYAGINNEVFFIGLGDKIEVWDKDKWEQKEKEVAKNAAEILEK